MVSATAAAAAPTTVMAFMIAITSPHALVLTVSHGSPVADSCLRRLLPAGSFTQLQTAPSGGHACRLGRSSRHATFTLDIRTLIFVRWPL
jgi:hypothetical protein